MSNDPQPRKDSLSTLEGISEARIARHGLPAGLMARMKASVKTWTVYLGQASSGAISDDRELAVGVLVDWLP